MSIMGYCQELRDARKMMRKRSTEFDSNYIEIIKNNSWQLVYRYDNTTFNRKVISSNILEILSFENDNFFLKYPTDSMNNCTGKAYFEDYFLFLLLNEVGEGWYYHLINLFDNRFIVVEVHKRVSDREIRPTKRRILFRKVE